MQPALLERLSLCQRVLLVGAGGGYDVYCGLPLYHWLKARSKEVHLASLSFRGQGLEVVDAPGAQPEECLSQFLPFVASEPVAFKKFWATTAGWPRT